MKEAIECTPVGESSNLDPPRRMHGGGLILASFAVFILSILLSDLNEEFALNGIMTGLANSLEKSVFYLMIFGVEWLVFILPLNLLVLLLYRRRRWRKYRTQFVLGPSWCVFALFLVANVFGWPTARRLFATEAGAPIPASAADLHSSGMHNVMGAINDVFYFHCDPSDTKKLIQEMHLSESAANTGYPLDPPMPGWPDARKWEGLRVYSFSNPPEFLFYTLVTNENENEVYLYLSAG